MSRRYRATIAAPTSQTIGSVPSPRQPQTIHRQQRGQHKRGNQQTCSMVRLPIETGLPDDHGDNFGTGLLFGGLHCRGNPCTPHPSVQTLTSSTGASSEIAPATSCSPPLNDPPDYPFPILLLSAEPGVINSAMPAPWLDPVDDPSPLNRLTSSMLALRR